MPDLATMKARLANELDRSDLSSNIAAAIQDAIEFHEKERFWFNESRDLTFNTVVGKRFYNSVDAAWIPRAITIDTLILNDTGGRNIDLFYRAPLLMELDSDLPGTGQPSDWTQFNEQLQLYPTPNAVWTIRAFAHWKLDPLTADSQSNAWTTQAESLIRHTARVLLDVDVSDDPQEAVGMNGMVQLQLAALRAETSRRRARGMLVPTEF